MFQTSKRTFRQAKHIINMADIVIAALVLICLVLSIFEAVKPMFFFPAIFYLGFIMNVLWCIKHFLNGRKAVGTATIMLSLVMLVVAVYATLVFWV